MNSVKACSGCIALTTTMTGSRETSGWLSRLGVLMLSAFVLAGCETLPREDPYLLYRELMPRSILVLPPINESVDVVAPYSYLTTVSEPIGEKGYYVFPVAVIDEFMKENGLPTPADMHAVPLNKIKEIIGADAVMYVTLEEFGQKFELLSSTTYVKARAELIDVDTGQVIWADSVSHAESSGNSGQGLLGSLVSAAIEQIGDTVNDRSHDAAIIANYELFDNASERRGLLMGPLHRGFTAEQERLAQEALEAEPPITDDEGAADSEPVAQ